MLTLHTHIKCQNYILIDCTINVTHTYIHGEMLFLHITHTHTHIKKTKTWRKYRGTNYFIYTRPLFLFKNR